MLEQKVVHSPLFILFYETILPFFFVLLMKALLIHFWLAVFHWKKKTISNEAGLLTRWMLSLRLSGSNQN